MCLSQGSTNLPGDVGGALLGKGAGVANRPVERMAFQVLHRHVVNVVVRAPVVEDRHRVGVGQLRRDAGFEEEAAVKLGIVLAGIVRIEHFDRACASERRLLGAIDLPHASTCNESHDLEAVADEAADERVGGAGRTRAAALRQCRRTFGHERRSGGETGTEGGPRGRKSLQLGFGGAQTINRTAFCQAP